MHLLRLYKRENLFLPFIFILFLNIIIGQFGFESMIRPIQFPSIDSSLENSVIKVFNTTDIGLISENDSIKILHKSQGINLQYKLDPFNIDINILDC